MTNDIHQKIRDAKMSSNMELLKEQLKTITREIDETTQMLRLASEDRNAGYISRLDDKLTARKMLQPVLIARIFELGNKKERQGSSKLVRLEKRFDMICHQIEKVEDLIEESSHESRTAKLEGRKDILEGQQYDVQMQIEELESV